VSKRRRSPKRKRRQSAEAVARKIAKELKRLKIHGKFEIERFDVDQTAYAGEQADFFWLASAQPNWIEFRATFYSRYQQDIADLDDVARAFLRPLIAAGYTGRSIAMARTVQDDEHGGYNEDEWRSLTATYKTRATLGQIEGAVERWDNRPNYIAATGFAVRIEIE
jgi:hypothetical protein